MHNLRPAILEQGLVAALQWMALRFEKRTGVVCDVPPADEAAASCRAGVPLVAYRTAQEALTNISKHAQATRVQIDLSLAGGVLSLEISDNGRGLSQDDLAKARSFGIRGLHERAGTVGGWVDLAQRRRSGTTLILSVPLDVAAAARTMPASRRRDDRRRPRASGPTSEPGTTDDQSHSLRRPRADPARHPRHAVRRARHRGRRRGRRLRRAARADARARRADVLVLDINLPGRSGLDVLHVLKDEGTAMRVLVVCMYPEDQYAIRALRAGAFGYVNKGGDPELIVSAVRTVAQGRKYVTPEIAQMLVESLTTPTSENAHDKLSDRELQTLVMIASGKRLSDIAEELMLSPKTVSVYRARVLEKLGLTNNSEMTVYAIRNGLVGN